MSFPYAGRDHGEAIVEYFLVERRVSDGGCFLLTALCGQSLTLVTKTILRASDLMGFLSVRPFSFLDLTPAIKIINSNYGNN